MKRILSLALSLTCVLALVGCSFNSPNGEGVEKPYGGAPKIVLNGYNYFASDLVMLNELPEGYSYAGELTDAEKEYASINGSKYYIQEGTETIKDFYVYQECGTGISDNEADNTKRQWAYVKWSKEQ